MILHVIQFAAEQVVNFESSKQPDLSIELQIECENLIKDLPNSKFAINKDTVMRAIKLTEYYLMTKLIISYAFTEPQDSFKATIACLIKVPHIERARFLNHHVTESDRLNADETTKDINKFFSNVHL